MEAVGEGEILLAPEAAIPIASSVLEQPTVPASSCSCGTPFASDAAFCRKCGKTRAGAQQPPGNSQRTAGTPRQTPSDCGSEPSASSSAVPGRVVRAAVTPGSNAGDTATPRRPAGTGGEANSLLTAIRRELKVSEERLTERVVRVERRAEQFRDAAFANVDEKFAEVRGRLPEYERKLAEMGGCLKGVQDELQALVRRVSSMDHAQSQRRTLEALEVQSKRPELELQEISTMNAKIQRLQVSFDELAGGSGRVDLAEVQIERLTEAFERDFLAEGRSGEGPPSFTPAPVASATGASPSMSQIMQCERMAREAEEAAEKAAREAERLSLQVRQAMTQSEEHKARMLMLIERVTQNEQQVRSVAARAVLNASDPLETSERLMSADGAEDQQASGPRSSPKGVQAEVDEIKQEMQVHWQGMHEVKQAVEHVNEKFTRDLKGLKEAHRNLYQLDSHRSLDGASEASRGHEANNGKASLLDEVQALRDCIVKGEAAIQKLGPKLLEAARSGQDLDFVQSVKGLQAVAGSPEADHYEEESQAQALMESSEWQSECPPSPAAAPGGKSASSCFGGCFRGRQ